MKIMAKDVLNSFCNIIIILKFIDIYKKPDCINGANVFVYRQGFWHLINIIKQETLNINNDYNYEKNNINNIENEKHEKERKEKC